MPKIIFNFKKIENIISCSLEDKMKDIFKKFASKEQIDINEFHFLYNNKIINDNLTLEQIITQEDIKNEDINIIVEKNKEESLNNINYKKIICPICQENIFIKIKDYKIILLNCKNGHKLEYILKDFIKAQKSIDSELKENNSKLVDDSLKNKMNEFKKYINEFKEHLEEIINKLKNVMFNLEFYYHLSSNFINNDESTQNTYEFIKYNDVVLNDIKGIILDTNIENKIKKIMNIYEKMNNKYTNYIIAELEIKQEDLNKNIRIINSFEQCKKEEEWEDEDDDCKCQNEKEIKENCEIKINNEIVPFSYFHKFDKEGKYQIQYSFKKNLTRTSCMFQGCKSLTYIDLSNFKSHDVTNMVSMFRDCVSLKNINLSNLNTLKVLDMSAMLYGCNSLTDINLSNFDTKNVTNLSYMFYECSSLVNVNLSNFTIFKYTDTSNMFSRCSSLAKIYLSNLNLKILLTWLACSLDIQL